MRLLGYVRAYKPELKFKEYDVYKGVYCSLCKTLLRRYTPLGQLFLSYDVTFLALVLFAVSEDCPQFQKSRCCYNPAKKCYGCGRNAILDFCADVSVLLMYYKVLDDLHDHGAFKKVLSALLFPAAFLMHKKAARLQPDAETVICTAMQKQAQCEAADCGADAAADPSAAALSALAALRTQDENLRQLFYLLGRFVYLIDAADDVEKDIRKNNFNPLKQKYISDPDAFGAYAMSLLNHNISEMLRLYDRIRFPKYDGILYNVLFNGLYNSAVYVTRKYAQQEVAV